MEEVRLEKGSNVSVSFPIKRRKKKKKVMVCYTKLCKGTQ